MAELKPCPFCGRRPSKVREHKVVSISTVFYSVACKAPDSKCGAKPMTRYHDTRDAAIEAWTRRAEDGNG